MSTAASYGRLLRSSGAASLAGAFLALGVATTMTPVALVLFAHGQTRSFATASLVIAASTAGGLLLGPARGRLVDRRGARTAVLWLAIPDVLTDIAFIVVGRAGVGSGVLVGLAFVAGAVSAPAATALRAVWSQTLGDETRQAGYALMSMLQETNFIAGPLLAGLIIALASPTAAVATTAGLSFVGALAFAAVAPATARHASTGASGRMPALAGGGIRTVVATSAAFGLTFGLLDVSFPAFARTHGSAATSGILLSAFAVGGLGGAFLYGLRPAAGPAAPRYPQLCLLAAVGLAPLILVPVLPVMAVLAAFAGVCFAPITNSQFAAVDELAPAGHKAEAFTWLSTLYGTGLALGAALAGQLITTVDLRAALAAACLATTCAWLLSTARRRSLAHPASTDSMAGASTSQIG